MKETFKYFWKELSVIILIIMLVSLSNISASLIQGNVLNALIEMDMHNFFRYILFLSLALTEYLALNKFISVEMIMNTGGQLQRLAIARGLLQNKKIILLDESTSKLDKESSLFIESILLAREDLTVIMITHHLDATIEQQLDDILYL